MRLGNSTVRFTDDDPVVFEGYQHQFIGGDEDDIGALMLCRADAAPTIWHAVLPAKAVAAVGSAEDKLSKLLAGKRFKYYEECTSTDEVFAFAEDGSVTVETGGVPMGEEEDRATPEDIKNALGPDGYVEDEPEYGLTFTTWMRVYEGEGKVYVLVINRVDSEDAAAPEFQIAYLEQEASPD